MSVQCDAWLAYRPLRQLVDARIARELEQQSGLSMPDYEVLEAVAEMSAIARTLSQEGGRSRSPGHQRQQPGT
ncbi:hypothetical protein [Thermoactinospora rubra]|uniref:hypothetical protein n=1 Tax=Thermoactinospora rubra TaxID=1088767 RepID=UPI000A106FF9|nr:hypothetical protein [Thermoactinospora rubra]